MPRFHCPVSLQSGMTLELPAGAARHVQVLRLQPGDTLTLFGGSASSVQGEFAASVTHMGRSSVQVKVGAFTAVTREATRRVHLAVGMPANDRMDWLVEKATELGVASIVPLLTDRSVLRLSGERAERKVAHWQSVAVAACEQCGGNLVPLIHPVIALATWLSREQGFNQPSARLLLSLHSDSQRLRCALPADDIDSPIVFLSGPEGGLSSQEEAAALASGYCRVTLGARVLRAETAALTALAALVT